MAPWDENVYFEIPVPSYPSILGNTAQQLVKQNQRRVGLLITSANTPGGPITVSPDTQLKPQSATLFQGITIGTGVTPLWIDQKSYGVLCQMEWWVANNQASAFTITVIELILYRWPELTERQQNDERVQSIVRSINESRGKPRDIIAVPKSEADYLFSAGWRNGYSK